MTKATESRAHADSLSKPHVRFMGRYLFDPFPFPEKHGLIESKQRLTAWKLVELVPRASSLHRKFVLGPDLHVGTPIADWTIILQKMVEGNETVLGASYDRVRPGDIAHVG